MHSCSPKINQKLMGKKGRPKSAYAIPCLCATLALIILAFLAGPLSMLWAHHLQYLEDYPLLASTLRFSLTRYTQDKLRSSNIHAHSPLPSLIEIEASPCMCYLRLVDLFHHHDTALSQDGGLINCTCPSMPTGFLSAIGSNLTEPSFANRTDQSFGNVTKASSTLKLADCNQKPEPVTVKASCLPPQKPVIKVEEPWFVKGRRYHLPPRFPRCTMDACFNYTSCENSDELLIYTYNNIALPAKYFQGINQSKYNTNDPSKACLFFVFLDTPGLYRSPIHPSTLPYWQGGLNHVLITFKYRWLTKGPYPESIGYASAMAPPMYETTYRPGFDVSIPVPAKRHFLKFQAAKPFDRKYLLTFRGLRYLQDDGILRSEADFRQMHNGEDIVVVTACRHKRDQDLRQSNPSMDEECKRDEALYDKYDYADLMNTTFGLAPAGRQSSSYRFAEVLSAGAVPVLIADNYVKPFNTLVQWHKCILQFPSTEMHRIVKSVRAMKRKEVERRQKYCLEVYNRCFSSDAALFEASVASQKTRFMGAFSAWPGLDD